MNPANVEAALNHFAFSIAHGTFDPDTPGGCSCCDCQDLLERIERLKKEEATKFYDEHYPPPGGFL